MQKILVLLLTAALTACGGGGDGPSPTGTNDCTAAGQKQFVLNVMNDWYLWNDLLPANVDTTSFSTPEALLANLTTFSPDDGSGSPIDRFSFINSAAADAAFFGEGQFEGFGFTRRFLAADDVRLLRVFASSPANAAGLARGQRILELNGRTIADIEAAEGVDAVLGTTPVDFTMREPNGSEFTATIAHDLVTIDPIPQFRIIPLAGTPGVGYMELATFISTADAEFDTVFGQLAAANVTDVIIDMRYNGGGLVSTSELLADYLGGLVAENLLYSETRFNDDRAAANDTSEFFELRGNSLGLSRLFIVADASTASASEFIINGLDPHVEVVIVGADTLGKPVGQLGFEFCDKLLRPTSFQGFNALGFGDYFDGLSVDCPATDDLSVPIGDDADPNIVAAMAYAASGACPVVSVPGGVEKPEFALPDRPTIDHRGRPERVYLDAF